MNDADTYQESTSLQVRRNTHNYRRMRYFLSSQLKNVVPFELVCSVAGKPAAVSDK